MAAPAATAAQTDAEAVLADAYTQARIAFGRWLGRISRGDRGLVNAAVRQAAQPCERRPRSSTPRRPSST